MSKSIVQITFEIDKSKGELEFRTFNSTQPAGGKMFAIVSKLTGDNLVNFNIYSCGKDGAELLKDKTVTINEFMQIINGFEATIQKINPSVRIVENNTDAAITNFEGEGVVNGQIAPEEILNILQGEDSPLKDLTKDEIADAIGGIVKEFKNFLDKDIDPSERLRKFM